MKKSDNEYIAEFMGLQVYQTYAEMQSVPLDQLKQWVLSDQTKYHTSWDQLMPVVEKIEQISKEKMQKLPTPGVDLDDHTGWRSWDYHRPDLTPDIGKVYKEVIEFIEWYNSELLKQKV